MSKKTKTLVLRSLLFFGFLAIYTWALVSYIGDCEIVIVQDCLQKEQQVERNDSAFLIGKHNAHLQLSKDFRVYEFLSKDPEAPEVYPISRELVTAVQFLRDYFDTPIAVNSVWRSHEHNQKVKGAKNSDHLTGFAGDYSFPVKPEIIALIDLEVKLQGKLFQRLLQLGVTSFGIYKGHLHIGTAKRAGAYQYDSFEYNYWSKRNSLSKGKIAC